MFIILLTVIPLVAGRSCQCQSSTIPSLPTYYESSPCQSTILHVQTPQIPSVQNQDTTFISSTSGFPGGPIQIPQQTYPQTYSQANSQALSSVLSSYPGQFAYAQSSATAGQPNLISSSNGYAQSSSGASYAQGQGYAVASSSTPYSQGQSVSSYSQAPTYVSSSSFNQAPPNFPLLAAQQGYTQNPGLYNQGQSTYPPTYIVTSTVAPGNQQSIPTCPLQSAGLAQNNYIQNSGSYPQTYQNGYGNYGQAPITYVEDISSLSYTQGTPLGLLAYSQDLYATNNAYAESAGIYLENPTCSQDILAYTQDYVSYPLSIGAVC